MKLAIAAFVLSFTSVTMADNINSVSFLRGCWESYDDGGLRTVDTWYPNTENAMFGFSQTVTPENKTVRHELMKMELNGRGDLTFIATIDGHKSPEFAFDRELSKSTPDTAVFVNPKSTAVNKVTFQREAADRLTVILGDGQMTFNYSRIDCADVH